MLRLLLIVALIVYVLSKLSGFLFRSGASQNRNFQEGRPDGNIRVDSVPKRGKQGNIKGGDYVDYEEVK